MSSEYATVTQTIRGRPENCPRMRSFAFFLVSTVNSYSSIGGSLAPATSSMRAKSNVPSSRNMRSHLKEPTRGVGIAVGGADGSFVGTLVGLGVGLAVG